MTNQCGETCERAKLCAACAREPAEPDRRLTDEIIAELWYKNGTHHHHFARAIERWLKGEQ